MKSKSQLGRFLRTRRAQLQPSDVGLATYGERRRVPGLRRDELAQLAGVSESYYTRLEQGLSLNASAEVLEAIARALRLDETESRHLHDLAGAVRKSGRSRPRRPAPERVTEATRQLMAAVGDTPAVVLGRRSDVLAWNRAGHARHRHRPGRLRLAERTGPARPGHRHRPGPGYPSGCGRCRIRYEAGHRTGYRFHPVAASLRPQSSAPTYHPSAPLRTIPSLACPGGFCLPAVTEIEEP